MAVIKQALKDGVATEFSIRGLSDEELLEVVKAKFWQPKYLPFKVE